jgi:hypothetical protein
MKHILHINPAQRLADVAAADQQRLIDAQWQPFLKMRHVNDCRKLQQLKLAFSRKAGQPS